MGEIAHECTAAEADIAVIGRFMGGHAYSVVRDLTPILVLESVHSPTAGKKRFKLLAEYEPERGCIKV